MHTTPTALYIYRLYQQHASTYVKKKQTNKKHKKQDANSRMPIELNTNYQLTLLTVFGPDWHLIQLPLHLL